MLMDLSAVGGREETEHGVEGRLEVAGSCREGGRMRIVISDIAATYGCNNSCCKPTFPAPFQLGPDCTGFLRRERCTGAGEACWSIRSRSLCAGRRRRRRWHGEGTACGHWECQGHLLRSTVCPNAQAWLQTTHFSHTRCRHISPFSPAVAKLVAVSELISQISHADLNAVSMSGSAGGQSAM